MEEVRVDLSSTSVASTARPTTSRRGSIPAVQFTLNPGEKAALKKLQQKEELRQEAQYLYEYFYQKTISSLIQTTRTNLDMLRKALVSSSTLGYGDATDDRKDKQPVFKLQVLLAIPNIVVKPGLEDVQSIVSEAAQVMLTVHKSVTQWSISSAEPLAATSQQPVGGEKRTFYKTVLENKEIAKLTVSLNSVITASKNTIMESFLFFNKYQDLWVTDQEAHLQEFMKENPLLGDFEERIHHYEKMEEQVMEEVDQIQIGAFVLDTSKRDDKGVLLFFIVGLFSFL